MLCHSWCSLVKPVNIRSAQINFVAYSSLAIVYDMMPGYAVTKKKNGLINARIGNKLSFKCPR